MIEYLTPMNRTGRRHFHTFDALRFFAFLKVFLLHLPIYAFPWFNYLKAGGGIGVQFFFVLSGFLITYIICEEKNRTGTFELKNFFVRRILRIWPLYYLMVAVAYLLPYLISYFNLSTSPAGYEPNIWASLTFMENYRVIYTGEPANSSLLTIMWTLCIEEHFYIIWGLLLYWLPIKKLPTLIAICIPAALCFRYIYAANGMPICDVFTNIDLFAFGAIPAYLLIARPEQVTGFVNGITRRKKLLFVAVLVATVVLISPYTHKFEYAGTDNILLGATTLLGAMFSLFIILLLPEENDLKVSDRNVLSRMGVYTYGLYLYHILAIMALEQLYIKMGLSLEIWLNALTYTIIAFAMTLAGSTISYHAFEKHFLKLKRHFR